jgi:outer membrane protein OmpA-like peptidoglycan-associated protein
MKNKIFTIFTFFFIGFLNFSANSVAQDIIWGNNVGIFGGGNFNLHSIDINPTFQTPGRIQTIFNNNENSISGFFGIEGNFQLSKITVLSGKISLNFAGVDFLQEINQNTDYSLETSLNYLEISPMIKFVNLFPAISSLYFTTGINFGLPITKSYNFESIRRGSIINSQKKEIPDADFRISLPVGIGYIYRLNEKISIIPEISYNFPLTNTSSAENWKKWNFQQIKAGISVTYMLPKGKKKVEAEIPEKNIFDVSIKEINYYNKAGTKKPLQSIRLEEFEFGEYFPLIPYIFYEINETELDEKYVNSSNEKVDFANLAGRIEDEKIAEIDENNEEIEKKAAEIDAIQISYKVADIIGKRMEENPNTNLTITGTIDGKFETEPEISLYRALGVKKYIISKYGIDASRIEIEAGQIPAKPSAQTVKDGIVENRRVEFSSNDQILFEPVFVRGERMRIANPDVIEFVPEVTSTKPITSWNLEIFQTDNLIKKISSEENSDTLKNNNSDEKIEEKVEENSEEKVEENSEEKVENPEDNNLKEEKAEENLENDSSKIENILPINSIKPIHYFIGLNELFPTQIPLDYKLTAYTNDSVSSFIGSIPIDFFSTERKKIIDQPDKIISKYSLVLFDFDSPEISAQNQSIIDKYVIPNIKYGSTIDIYGFSDRIGNPEYNQNLSTARANSVKDYILTKNKNVPINTIGLGNDSEIFDNDLPIGRQLSRTVQILVVTPK